MKIRVFLERVYEINCDELEELGFNSIEDVTGMEEVDVLEEEANITTTWLRGAELVEEDKTDESI